MSGEPLVPQQDWWHELGAPGIRHLTSSGNPPDAWHAARAGTAVGGHQSIPTFATAGAAKTHCRNCHKRLDICYCR